MIRTASRLQQLAIRVLRVFLGLAFLIIGAAKLTGTLNTVETFTAFGFGQWFRYFTGLLDITGAILVFLPRWTWYGALLLTATVGLATMLSLTRPDRWPAFSLTLLAASLAWLTRPRRVQLMVAALCLAAMAGCTMEQPASADDDTAAAQRSAFEASTTAFHQALRTDHADSLFMYVADDVVLMLPGESVVRGKNAMRDWYAGFLSQYRTASLTLANREVFVSGEWAVELGSYDGGSHPRPAAQPSPTKATTCRFGGYNPTGSGVLRVRSGTVQCPRPQPRNENV
jgi:ketosteroid isomerase-like protein/uncharacterized membrane protein YphA (DoxX/SURF4 family)